VRREQVSRATWWMALLGAIAVAAFSVTLIADGIRERVRAAQEAEVVEALEVRVPTEAAVAEELEQELDKQTQRSVARDQRNQRLAWGLLISAVFFLASAKGYQALHPARRSTLITIGRPAAGKVVSARDSQRPAVAVAAALTDALDLDAIDSIIAAIGRDREATIPILQAIQSRYRYLPEAALQRVCEATEIAPAQIIGVASFYSQFRRDPVGQHLVRICHGTACHVAGIGPIMDELRRQLHLPPDADTDPERRFTIESVNCLGCCSLAPVMMIEDHVAGHLTPTSAWQELEAAETGS
jgi:NADH:ubiquinone oxidoreductase subunit E